MRKGQMEIMGLMIIMILLTLGMLFVIKFVILDKSEESSSQAQVPANLLNAMLQTNIPDCGGEQIKSLFRDCALTNEITCTGNINSCQYLNITVKKILDSTLVAWNNSFYFNASGTNDNIVGGLKFGKPCPSDFDHKMYPIQAKAKTILITLMICK